MTEFDTSKSDQPFWKRWKRAATERLPSLQNYIRKVLAPGLDADAEQALAAIQDAAPPPVFWLLGKTQSGKSAIVRTLTGSTAAEVGAGFRPCTRTAAFFDYPDSEAALLRFLDTRGLAESGYDAGEDMAWCESQSHLLLVVVKAMDLQLQTLVDCVRRIRAKHPEWPLIVAQTCLHEGYPSPAMEHPQPYPYPQSRLGSSVPSELRLALLKQRELFADAKAVFVPIDFTLLEDGYSPADYGIDALWAAIESAFPLGLRAILDAGRINDVYSRTAHGHIVGFALAVGCAAALPLPTIGLTATVALQGKLFHSIASIYGLPLTRQSISEIVGVIGLSAALGLSGRELLKWIPYYGQTVAAGLSGLYSASVTYALGKTLCFYFSQTRQGKALSSEAIKTVFRREFLQGGKLLRDALKNRNRENP